MAAAKQSVTLSTRLTALWNSPTGPKTTHFWVRPMAHAGAVAPCRCAMPPWP